MSAARKTLLALAGCLALGECAAAPGDDPAPPAAAPAKPAAEEEVAREVHGLLDEARAPRKEFSEAAKLYARARERVSKLMQENPGPRTKEGGDLLGLATEVERDRREFFQRRMPAQVYAWLRQRALEAKGTFEEVRIYLLRQVADDLWDHLLRVTGDADHLDDLDRLTKIDPEKITAAERERAIREATVVKGHRFELMDSWKDRPKDGGCTTSYGSGTFIVVPDGGKDPAVRTQGPMPDQWWDQATPELRADWLLSFCAEKAANLLEVARVWNDPCPACSGTGSKDSTLCPACNGSRVVRRVLWR